MKLYKFTWIEFQNDNWLQREHCCSKTINSINSTIETCRVLLNFVSVGVKKIFSLYCTVPVKWK